MRRLAAIAATVSALAFGQERSPFDSIAVDAAAARAAGRNSQAAELYRKGVALRPGWAEGWGQLGAILYEQDRYTEAAAAFARAVKANPSSGAALVMLGLTEAKLGRDAEALEHIRQGRRAGAPPDPQFRSVMFFTEGTLLLRRGEFDSAREAFGEVSRNGSSGDELLRALGLAALRIPSGASSPAGDAVLLRAGRAEHAAARNDYDAATAEYARLVEEFPNERNVNYAYGRMLLLMHKDEEAVVAFQREIRNSPDHVLARLGIANAKLRTAPAAGIPYAEEAVKLAPKLPLSHHLLGMLLLETNQPERAVRQFEEAIRLYPKEPVIYFALARAYAAAGRRADADRARAEFVRLKRAESGVPQTN